LSFLGFAATIVSQEEELEEDSYEIKSKIIEIKRKHTLESVFSDEVLSIISISATK
jgi:hypothetical protein